MKIRRYLGYDADSVNGFNNGRYVDSEPIEVKDHSEAEELCAEALEEYTGMPRSTFDYTNAEMPEVKFISGYYNEHGDELTVSEFQELSDDKCHYRYVFVNAEVIEE